MPTWRTASRLRRSRRHSGLPTGSSRAARGCTFSPPKWQTKQPVDPPIEITKPRWIQICKFSSQQWSTSGLKMLRTWPSWAETMQTRLTSKKHCWTIKMAFKRATLWKEGEWTNFKKENFNVYIYSCSLISYNLIMFLTHILSYSAFLNLLNCKFRLKDNWSVTVPRWLTAFVCSYCQLNISIFNSPSFGTQRLLLSL